VVSTIIDRGYVKKLKNVLTPTFTGFAVTRLMSNHFSELVDFGFTSQMEESLDKIASGELEYIPYLKEFYLGEKGLQSRVAREDHRINPEEARTMRFDHIQGLDIHIGKFGPYFQFHDPETKTVTKASVPEDMAPADLNMESIKKIVEQVKEGPKSLAIDPATGKKIFLRTGSYGPYLQLGEASEAETGDGKGRLKRVSVPKTIEPSTLTAELAIGLINLPRKLGPNPANGKDIVANTGRFGPYVMCDGDFRSLKKEDNVISVTYERALNIFSQPKKSRRRGQALRDLGEHPDTKTKIEIFDGPYGPYIKYGKSNVSIPKEMDHEKITLEAALGFIRDKGDEEPVKAAAKSAKSPKKKAVKKPKKALEDDQASDL
jgi:DNA topoisomerase-1